MSVNYYISYIMEQCKLCTLHGMHLVVFQLEEVIMLTDVFTGFISIHSQGWYTDKVLSAPSEGIHYRAIEGKHG